MHNHYPIGVFDSGIGGLSVLRELQLALPSESFVYVADSENAPYGDKSESYIQERVLTITDFLSKQAVKAIVVACNTATAAAVNLIRKQYDIPIIALEPAVKPAVLATKNGIVGVLATSHTLASHKYQQLKAQYKDQATILDVACQGLVELIENNKQDSADFYQLLSRYLQPLQDHHIDTLVLGCTHYPFAKNSIQKILSSDIKILDSGYAVAKETHRQLYQRNLLNPASGAGEVHFYSNKIDANVLAFLSAHHIEVSKKQLFNI